MSSAESAFRVAIVVSRYNDFVCEPLRRGALDALTASGVTADRVSVHWVPGAYELPFAARAIAQRGQVDAIVCLGCLIKGETPHFELIASAVAHGLMQVQLDAGVPIAFGVLTTLSAEQAVARAGDGPSNKGREAALAALEMARLRARLSTEGAGR
ncbi:MAG: 6,7-dimethyl-8-ribityllumazine synthase [Vicinamibacterales bacterium]